MKRDEQDDDFQPVGRDEWDSITHYTNPFVFYVFVGYIVLSCIGSFILLIYLAVYAFANPD